MGNDPRRSLERKGYVLPLTVFLSVMLLTAFGYWYQQVVLQSHLADRLVEQRRLYLECHSMLPWLIEQLEGLKVEQLNQEAKGFVRLVTAQQLRWEIDRSGWLLQRQIRFTFRWMEGQVPPLELTVNYQRSGD